MTKTPETPVAAQGAVERLAVAGRILDEVIGEIAGLSDADAVRVAQRAAAVGGRCSRCRHGRPVSSMRDRAARAIPRQRRR